MVRSPSTIGRWDLHSDSRRIPARQHELRRQDRLPLSLGVGGNPQLLTHFAEKAAHFPRPEPELFSDLCWRESRKPRERDGPNRPAATSERRLLLASRGLHGRTPLHLKRV